MRSSSKRAGMSRPPPRPRRAWLAEIGLDDGGIVADGAGRAFGDAAAIVHHDRRGRTGASPCRACARSAGWSGRALSARATISCISAVSVSFMPAVGSSSSSRRGRNASARAIFDAAAVGVGEAVRRDCSSRGVRRSPNSARMLSASACSAASSARTAARRNGGAVAVRARGRAQVGRTRSRVWAPTSTLSSTLRLANTRPCWNVRARPRRGERLGRAAVTSCAPEGESPASGAVEPADQVEQRGLAGAVGADDADELALRDLRSMPATAVTPPKCRLQSRALAAAAPSHDGPEQPCGRKRISSQQHEAVDQHTDIPRRRGTVLGMPTAPRRRESRPAHCPMPPRMPSSARRARAGR